MSTGAAAAVERASERGGSRGKEENVRLTRGARGKVKCNRTCGPANPKAPEVPMVQRKEHRCNYRCNFDQI